MDPKLMQRIIGFADYIITTNSTIRQTATVFGYSKTTVHKDLSQRLPSVDQVRFRQIQKIFRTHYMQKHIRGGESTRKLHEQRRKFNERCVN
ncbi:MAG TPA: stage III sporulation protein D [Firmicutes bacterium]|jgi:putative DeoR family transcriptional regulator (stage III sporulation protein D)|nr:stage III sporulation protein D [Bacillota bacterium]